MWSHLYKARALLIHSISNFSFVLYFFRFHSFEMCKWNGHPNIGTVRCAAIVISSIPSVVTRILRADEYYILSFSFSFLFNRRFFSRLYYSSYLWVSCSFILFCLLFSFAFSIAGFVPNVSSPHFSRTHNFRLPTKGCICCDFMNSKKVLKYHGKLIDAKRFIYWRLQKKTEEKLSIKCYLIWC